MDRGAWWATDHGGHKVSDTIETNTPRSYCTWMVNKTTLQFSSVTQPCPTLPTHESQHARPPCPSPTRGVHLNSCPSSWWCHPAISSSVIPCSSCPQSLPASESFPMSQLCAWGGQSTGVSALASFLPKNTKKKFLLNPDSIASVPRLPAGSNRIFF